VLGGVARCGTLAGATLATTEEAMSLMHPYDVTDSDGQRHHTMLADCLNIQRTPAARQRILERSFHKIDAIGKQVEKAFFYLDLARGQAMLVQPPRERYRNAKASAQLEHMLGVLPAAMRAQAQQIRVVYGLEELREKLIAADAGFDDRAVELMKAALIHDHPVLLTRARLRLVLDEVNAQGAIFLAQYDHSPKSFRLTYNAPEVFMAEPAQLHAWSATMHKNDLYALPARGQHWVNYRRWVPSQDAMTDLHALVAELAAGRPPAVRSKPFADLLKRLPRGSALSTQGKDDLRKLFEWAKAKGQQKLQDQLFEIRFGVALEDSWYRNDDKDDIDTLWRLLKNLPSSHVEGNSKLSEIDLGQSGGGTYSPSTHEIEIGSSELAFKENFEDTLRHEVGHAVHEANAALVDGWLWQRFGWAEFDATQAGVDDWAALMGPKAGYAALGVSQKAQVRSLLRQACGPGSQWGPTISPNAPATSPWRAAGFGPRLAFEQSGSEWWTNNQNWYRANGKAFAVNFWYGTLLCINEAVLDFINRQMPDTYAAMSPKEFFAETYALHYDLDDPQRRNIPADVKAWIDQHLGSAQASQPARPAAAGSTSRRKSPGAAAGSASRRKSPGAAAGAGER
jgi:hypothetical protein